MLLRVSLTKNVNLIKEYGVISLTTNAGPESNSARNPMKRLLRFNNTLYLGSFIVSMVLTSSQCAGQIDADASEKTKALYANLKLIQNGSHFLFGQEFFNSYQYSSGSAHGNYTFSDSKEVTGAHPAVLGSDFYYYLENGVTERGYHTEAVKWAYQQGYAITFDWHVSGKGTATYEYADATKDLVDSIVAYPHGQDRTWLYAELDKVIDIINNSLVVGNDRIPIVFRPWHEMNGGWFWWGTQATTAANYKAFYGLTVEYVKARTTSVLFCWSPNTPFNFDYYPGDTLVDILGVDYYEATATQLRQELASLVDHAQTHDKVAVFSETGNRTTNGDDAATYWKNTILPAIVNDPSGKSIKIAWVLTWINANWSFPYVPHAGSSTAAKQSFMDFKNSPYVLFGDAIQSMYSPWVILSVPQEPRTGSEALQLFPMPADNFLTIKLNGFSQPTSINVYDIAGRLVYQVTMDTEEIDLSVKEILKPGLYLVKANDYSKTITKKIVVR